LDKFEKFFTNFLKFTKPNHKLIFYDLQKLKLMGIINPPVASDLEFN